MKRNGSWRWWAGGALLAASQAVGELAPLPIAATAGTGEKQTARAVCRIDTRPSGLSFAAYAKEWSGTDWDIYGRYFCSTGLLHHLAIDLTLTWSGPPAVAYARDIDKIAIVWGDEEPSLCFAFLTPLGGLSGPTHIPMDEDERVRGVPDVTYVGWGTFMAAWRSGDEVMVTKIRPSGWFANPLRMAVPNHSFSMNPSLAHAGSGRAVVVCQATPDPPPWDDPTFGVFAALVRSDLTVGGAIVELGGTRPAGETRTDPRIASGWRPGECLVVWSGPTIMGQHLSVTPTGSVALVGAPFRLVPSSPYGRHPWGPTVAWDPLSQYYHVVWAAMGDDWEWLILGTRVRARQPRPHPWHRETAWVRSVGDEVYTPALDFATRRLGGYRSAGALSWERQKHAAETDQDVYGSPLPTTGGRVAWNDYTGDSASDLAVYNTLSGKWYVKSLRPGGVSWNGRVWGNAGTTPVTGDYAGYDSWQCTRAVYERDTGKWYFSSTSGDWSSSWVWWGGRGMDPVPGVYGRHPYWDLAVYERDTGDWFILDSRFPGVPILYRANWGGPGTVPVPGDYDGDDVWDLAVYAGNTGRWYIRSLNPSLPAICMGKNWGGPGMVPVPGDYDGDGIWDLAMYHKGTGNWYIRRVDDGVPLICFGLNWGGALGDPVPGDYNGDGIYDLAVYERATGKWYILNRVSRVPIVFGLPWGSSSMDPVGVCR